MSSETFLVPRSRIGLLKDEKAKLAREGVAAGLKEADIEKRLNWLYRKAVEARADLTEIKAMFGLTHEAPMKLLVIKIENAVKAEKEQADAASGQFRPGGIMNLRQTHTCAILELSEPAFKEIAQKLQEAGYSHAFDGEGKECTIDMHGIAVQAE